MIHSQLGSLQSSAPTAPSWREEKKLDCLEEGKKDDELAPIYVEGRTEITDFSSKIVSEGPPEAIEVEDSSERAAK